MAAIAKTVLKGAGPNVCPLRAKLVDELLGEKHIEAKAKPAATTTLNELKELAPGPRRGYLKTNGKSLYKLRQGLPHEITKS